LAFVYEANVLAARSYFYFSSTMTADEAFLRAWLFLDFAGLLFIVPEALVHVRVPYEPSVSGNLRLAKGIVQRFCTVCRANRPPLHAPAGFATVREQIQTGVEAMAVSQELLDILVCPLDKAPVHLKPDQSGLKCEQCHRVYPIKDDIPVMLIDEATIESE
jgi:uncharacterized protein YbaR (Trm112 family)